jgi:hypothetical protein
MATYVEKFAGYVGDVPRLWFKRCDGRIFYFDELTAATVTPNVQYTEVNAGWSLFPVAYLPGASTFEMQITSGKFEADLFVMTNATKFMPNSTYKMACTETLDVDGENHVELTHQAEPGTISIPYPVVNPEDTGMMEETAQTASAGKFKRETISGVTRLTFAAGDVGDKVTVSYYYTEDPVQEARIDNRSSAMGEAILQWPVYGNGDDCTDAAIIGYVTVKVFKCRVTTQPGMDSSYKTAGTYQFTLAAMDAKQADEAAYSISYKRVA